jgi:hypothetical protein
MHLSGGYFDGKRSAVAVSNQVEFRSKPASADFGELSRAAAQRVVGRFIRVALDAFLSATGAARAAHKL